MRNNHHSGTFVTIEFLKVSLTDPIKSKYFKKCWEKGQDKKKEAVNKHKLELQMFSLGILSGCSVTPGIFWNEIVLFFGNKDKLLIKLS